MGQKKPQLKKSAPASNCVIAPVATVAATAAASSVQGLSSPSIGNDVSTDEAVQSVIIVLLYIESVYTKQRIPTRSLLGFKLDPPVQGTPSSSPPIRGEVAGCIVAG